jgi:hypothetical protein
MTKLTLVIRDLMHGGCLDSDAVTVLALMALCVGVMGIIGTNIWSYHKLERRFERWAGSLEDER